jgi:hypothetical protein
MAYVPTIPGFTPVTYGQGFGDWQQYAGYSKTNPFGSSPSVVQKSVGKAPIAPTTQLPTTSSLEVKPPDYSLVPPTQMGTLSKTPFGNFSQDQFGQGPDFMSILKKDEEDF